MRIDARVTKLENRVTPRQGTVRLIVMRFCGEDGDGSLFKADDGRVFTEAELAAYEAEPGEALLVEQVLTPEQVAELGL
jgi:hypothetical protein